MILDIIRRSLGNLDPKVKYSYFLGNTHHNGHIMFDKDHGLPPGLVQLFQEPDHILLFLKGHPRKRLIKDQ